MIRRLGVSLAAIVGCLVVSATPSTAATEVSVDCGAGANLQAAINAAKPGSILVVSGTCHGSFTVGKNLVLKGASAAVLDAQRTGATLTVTAGKVRVTRMTITGGLSDDVGGVLNLGTLTLVRDTVSGNESGEGGTETGGIENDGTLVMQRSFVAGNRSEDIGGIWNTGTATLDQTTVGPNRGSAITSTGSFTLTDSTVTGNSGTYNGGIVNVGVMAVLRSTIANNNAFNGDGAGIANGGTVTVVQSTIAGNRVDEFGAGIENVGLGTATLTATIVAGNTDQSEEEQSDCRGSIVSGGHNLFGTPCDGAISTDQSGTFDSPLDAMLKVLGSYGGPTQTMVPRPNSPAVNKIPIGAPDGLCPPSGTTDQRGIARPQSGACDIGSVERKPKE
jgi:hypothetical protein